MSELPNVTPGEIITSSHINDIKDRSIQRYATTADRDLENPTPQTGDAAYVSGTSTLEIWDNGWKSYTQAGKFISNNRGVNPDPVTLSSTNVWTTITPSVNLGTPDLGVWVTAQFTASVLIPSGGADGVYRSRVEISIDSGNSWLIGDQSWGVVDGTNRRQNITAAHFVDAAAIAAGQGVFVRGSVLRSAGGDPTFDDMTITAQMSKTTGQT